MPHPTTTVLDDEALAQIEARHKLASRIFQPYKEVSDSLSDIPALCATVKHLRDRERTILAVNAELIEGNHAAHVALDKAGIKREDVAWEGPIQHVTEYPVCDRIGFLQSQLEQLRTQLAQVEQERNRLKEAVSEIAIKKYDEWAFGQCQGLAKRALEKL